MNAPLAWVDTRSSLRRALTGDEAEGLVAFVGAGHHGAMARDVAICFPLAWCAPTPRPLGVWRAIRRLEGLTGQKGASGAVGGNKRSLLYCLANLFATRSGFHHRVCSRVRGQRQEAHFGVVRLPAMTMCYEPARLFIDCSLVIAHRILTEYPTRCLARVFSKGAATICGTIVPLHTPIDREWTWDVHARRMPHARLQQGGIVRGSGVCRAHFIGTTAISRVRCQRKCSTESQDIDGTSHHRSCPRPLGI